MNCRVFVFLMVFFLALSACDGQEHPPKLDHATMVHAHQLVAGGIEIPWGMEFISPEELLVTEKSGELYYIKKGVKKKVSGLPKVYVNGQGGLLDIALDPAFERNSHLYLTLSTGNSNHGGNTALYRAVLHEYQLRELTLLYRAEPDTKKGQHWGSRIVFDRKGYLYFSIGDRGERDVNPQDVERDGGKIYRLYPDGSIPEDNPFQRTDGTSSAVYSYGHRNPQGLSLHPETGKIWSHEHGPRGGDEINIVEAGKNYGWPTITYGINYIGTPITDKTRQPGMEQPLYYWLPSIAPSGMAFSSSEVYQGWKGNLFVGSLKFQYLERLVIRENKVVKREKILENIGRVRDVKEGPDGYLYVAAEGKGILKLLPNQ
ncbi:MAG: PQQ-dependent sugar dehydrogenase [Lutibacter sp.]|nr:PQQ-dependent sugar dehydrogenase [Lutibacter sp.]